MYRPGARLGRLELADVAVEFGDDAHRGMGGDGERGRDRGGGGQLLGAQRGADLVGARGDVALAPATFERRLDALSGRCAPRSGVGARSRRVAVGSGPRRPRARPGSTRAARWCGGCGSRSGSDVFLGCAPTCFEPEDTRRHPNLTNGSVLDRHDIPAALQATRPTGRGHNLTVGIDLHSGASEVLTGSPARRSASLDMGQIPVNGTLTMPLGVSHHEGAGVAPQQAARAVRIGALVGCDDVQRARGAIG